MYMYAHGSLCDIRALARCNPLPPRPQDTNVSYPSRLILRPA